MIVHCVLLSASSDQFGVLVDNPSIVHNNNVRNVTFISVPFSGHCHILMKYALDLAREKKKDQNISFLVTGWENIRVANESLQTLQKAGIRVQVINDAALNSPAPMTFTFPRVCNLVDQVVEEVKGSDLIIYDFFAIEGFLAGDALGIPTICSIPAIVGPFNPNNADFKEGIARNRPFLETIKTKFSIDLTTRLEMVSDAFLLPSKSENIIWSWPELIKASDFLLHRNMAKVTFARPEKELPQTSDFPVKLKPQQKLIYVSLGTVVTKNLWNNIPEVRAFVSDILQELVRGFGGNEAYQIIVSTGRPPHEVIQNAPSNFHLFEHVAQEQVLAQADLFITHGGGNSVNEAIDAETPMIVIPFFGDQHLSALDVATLRIGLAFGHTPQDRERAINTEARLFYRETLHDMKSLTGAVIEVISDCAFKENIRKVKKNCPVLDIDIIPHRFVLKWKEGDLLFGTNGDRKAFALRCGLESYFKIGDFRPFPELVREDSYENALPRLVDQYNDALRGDPKTGSAFLKYEMQLNEFHKFLLEHPSYILPLGHYPKTLSEQDPASLETVWNMCLGGLDFFIFQKKATIHFALKDYDQRINKATSRELQWIKARWNEDPAAIQERVKFYRIQVDGSVSCIPPETVLK